MDKNTFSDLINDDKPALIDFSAEWCGPCKMMVPILKELKHLVGDRANILKVDIDRNPTLASKLNIQGVPTLILFQRGKILWRQSGVLSAESIYKIILTNIR